MYLHEKHRPEAQKEIMIELFMVKVTLALFVDGLRDDGLKSDPFAQVHYPLH